MARVRRRGWRAAAVIAAVAALTLAGCKPSLDWRETQSTDGKFAAVFPGKPKVETRQIPFGATKIPMTMTAAGKGPTLFAVGVARLPADAIATPEATEATVARFRDALLVNARTTIFSLDNPPPALPAEVRNAARGLLALRASRHPQMAATETDRVQQVAAQFFVIEDRLYQVAALGDADLTSADLETFFTSFKLLP